MKRFLIAVLLAVSLVSCKDDDRSDASKASAALDAGLKAQVEGRTADAVANYRKVLAADPKNKFAFYNLGLLDQQAGRSESAVQFYRQALAVDPDYVPAMFNLAISLTPTAPDEAITLYRNVIARDSKHAGAHLNLGLLLRSRGQTAEGDALIATATSLDPALASTTTTTP